MFKNEAQWVQTYKDRGAFWFHDGNPLRPHALLTSGKHSGAFCDSEFVLEDPALLDQAASDLFELLVHAGLNPYGVDCVVGPAMGAITIAHDLARNISQYAFRKCLRAYTEKEGGEMVFNRTVILPGSLVLLSEDVSTTGETTEKAARAVESAGGIVLPFMAVLLNRSGLSERYGRKIVALIEKEMPDMPAWDAESCHLCKAGSVAILPKKKENRALLRAEY